MGDPIYFSLRRSGEAIRYASGQKQTGAEAPVATSLRDSIRLELTFCAY